MNQPLIDKLNAALADEYGAVIQYTTYAAMTHGLSRPELAAFFEKEIPDEQGHAALLSNKIVSLGGTPVVKASEVPVLTDNRAMLEAVLEAEKRAVKTYTELVELAEQAGEKGLALTLEELIMDETNHKEEVEKMLRQTS